MVQFSPIPSFPTGNIATLPLLGLSEDEQHLIRTLQSRAQVRRAAIQLSEAYYLGQQVIQNLRIAVPKELEFLRTIVGWPALAVDPYVERLYAEGFRQASATDGDALLAEVMDANGFESEQSLAFTDALSMSPAYWCIGSPVERGGFPVVTVESPLNMSVLWDLRGTTPRAAMNEYWAEDGTRRGALLVPNQTVHLATDDKGDWVIVDRDEHDFDFVPVVRMANRPRTNNRDGYSEISPAVQSLTDAACRTLLGLEVAREIYSVPQMILLGATESAFQKTDGTPKAAWETYITKMLALERDENGDLPQIVQKTVYDPATFSKLLDWYASSMAGIVAAPPQDIGLYTQGNPASAEAGLVADDKRNRRAKRMWRQFAPPLVQVAQTAIRFMNKGVLPKEYARLAVDWAPVEMLSPGITSDAVAKEIAAGSVPATSDVTLKRLGYSTVERARLAQDRSADDGRNVARALVDGLLPRTEVTGGDAAEGV